MRDYKKFLTEIEKTSPDGCFFKVGDVVTFTNDYKVKFKGKKIIGFAKKEDQFNGRFIYLDGENDAFWFPAKPESLKLEV